jgi:hypothetical protein
MSICSLPRSLRNEALFDAGVVSWQEKIAAVGDLVRRVRASLTDVGDQQTVAHL